MGIAQKKGEEDLEGFSASWFRAAPARNRGTYRRGKN